MERKAMKKLPRTIATLLLTLVVLAATPPPDSPVADAAMRGDLDAVRSLINQGADVNGAQGDGMTALHWAAENGSAATAELLLSAGANLSAVTRLGGYTPLHLAAKAGSADVVRAFLAAGADPRAATSTGGATALHFAAAAGSGEAVKALIDHGADPNASESAWGQTPLMFAAASDRAGAIHALVDGGADPAITARVIDIAARDGEDREAQRRRDERVEALQQLQGGTGGGRPAQAQPEPTVSTLLNPDEPPPSLARDRDRTVPQPLSHADLVGHYGGLTALLMAVRDGRRAAAEALLDRGADITLASDAGATPLYGVLNTQWIPKSRHPQPTDYTQQETTYLELIEIFLEAGADPNVRLHKTLWYTEFGRSFLSVDRMGATPFWRAAFALDVTAMRLLVAHGADPHIPTVNAPRRFRRGGRADMSGLPPVPIGGPGSWPIHAASGITYGEGFAANVHRHVPEAWVPAVRYLVEELGADVNARDRNGYTAVHHAAARGDNELILYLVSQGADVTAVSRSGQTTADMANGPVQRILPFPSTVELLESLGSHNNNNCVAC
ncbi:MAG: hypothetical protein F4151_04045 [Gammaproteobacteria bacterium]|nr:hypothetical protein [Gammaproteobacteria bacterium]